MTRRYLRGVRVTVGDATDAVQIDDLFVRFRVRREATSTPAEGVIDVYNLNQSNETRIRERGRRVQLEAGYAGELETIFDGDVRRVERERVDLDRITRIHVGGNVERQTRSVFDRSYAGAVSVRDIVRDGIAALGFSAGSLDLIPADATETDFSFTGPTRIMLTHRLRPLGLEWYEDAGVVRISKIRETADDRPQGVTISEQSGMIGSPTTTDDGIRVRTLLDPRLTLDARVRVLSRVLADAASGDAVNEAATEVADGQMFKVIEFEHAGDNREGDFVTTIEARPVS